MSIEQYVFPGNKRVIENDQRVDFIELVTQRVIGRRRAPGKAGTADHLDIFVSEVTDEAYSVVRVLVVTGPVGDGRLGKRLVGVSGGGFELGAAHHDAGIGFTDHVQQHVRILLLRRPRAVALGVCIRRHLERILRQQLVDVSANVIGKLRIDLVEHCLGVVQRPHFTNGFITDAGDHAADVVEYGIGGVTFVLPVLLRTRQPGPDRMCFAVIVGIGH
jgi:hypothetical protein